MMYMLLEHKKDVLHRVGPLHCGPGQGKSATEWVACQEGQAGDTQAGASAVAHVSTPSEKFELYSEVFSAKGLRLLQIFQNNIAFLEPPDCIRQLNL